MVFRTPGCAVLAVTGPVAVPAGLPIGCPVADGVQDPTLCPARVLVLAPVVAYVAVAVAVKPEFPPGTLRVKKVGVRGRMDSQVRNGSRNPGAYQILIGFRTRVVNQLRVVARTERRTLYGLPVRVE